jgi:predicted naringenin-chalcone synthase
MPVIRSVATALPPHKVPQERIRDLAREHFAPALPEIDRYMSVFRHAQIDTRHFVAPLEWFTQPRSFKECNDLFIEAATALGESAAGRCLDAAGLEPADVDHLMWVSTTGLAAPSPDALLINRLGENTTEFLAQHQLGIDDIDHWILHPGGAKVISAYESALAIDSERLGHTWAVLRDCGNMSSATVFFVLESFLKAGLPRPGEYGVLAVLGPGFSCELALVRG